MRTASDIAEWWDEQHRQSAGALDEFVDQYPGFWGVLVATTVATAADLGAGVVDVLRFGEGVSEGGLRGFGRETLRILQIAPGVGRVGNLKLARVIVDPGGGICTWVSAAKALRHVGARAFASVDDLARAAGFQAIGELGGAFVDEVANGLQLLGARVTMLGAARTLEQVHGAVRGSGIALFSVRWLRHGEAVAHTLYAFRDALGRIRYADRTGHIVANLDELQRLVPGYGNIGSATVYGPTCLVEGPVIKEIGEGMGILAMEVLAQLAVDPSTAAQVLEVKKLREAPVQGSQYHVASKGDWLSKLAFRYYGDMYKWPVIYEANRKVIGNDPDMIHPGQRFVIPPLASVSATRERR